MSAAATPNWLTIVGLVYSAVGVMLLATAVAAAAQVLGAGKVIRKRAARSFGTYGALGAMLAVLGFFFQGAGQFVATPLGGPFVVLLLALIAVLAMFAMSSAGAIGASANDELAESGYAEHPVAAPTTIAPAGMPATSPATVKLVSAG